MIRGNLVVVRRRLAEVERSRPGRRGRRLDPTLAGDVAWRRRSVVFPRRRLRAECRAHRHVPDRARCRSTARASGTGWSEARSPCSAGRSSGTGSATAHDSAATPRSTRSVPIPASGRSSPTSSSRPIRSRRDAPGGRTDPEVTDWPRSPSVNGAPGPPTAEGRSATPLAVALVGLRAEIFRQVSAVPASSRQPADVNLAHVGPTTPTRTPGLPLAVWRLDGLRSCRTFSPLNDHHPRPVTAYNRNDHISASRPMIPISLGARRRTDPREFFRDQALGPADGRSADRSGAPRDPR